VKIDATLVRKATREEMKLVFEKTGLHDDAGDDVWGLRVLINDWREMKRAIWQALTSTTTPL
jgi:hypothetical protein